MSVPTDAALVVKATRTSYADGGDVSVTTEEVSIPALPEADRVGDYGHWVVSSREQILEFDGRFLGMSSSRREVHEHSGVAAAGWGGRCGACRWFEPRIFRETYSPRGPTDDEPEWGRYLILFSGRTVVPGETTRTRHEWVRVPHEVVEVLTTRRVATRTAYLTGPAARVLAQAAGLDDELNDAYVNRAVS